MPIEIEAKIRVEDLRQLEEKLRAIDARCIESVREEDIYFDATDGKLAACGCGLRLRKRQSVVVKTMADKNCGVAGGDEEIILTYKGPVGRSVYKSRAEIEVKVSDFASAMGILESLGYQKRIAFEKRRRVFGLGGCLVCLDELPVLGSFVEVEGPDEDAIGRVLKSLDLDGREHISQGYAKLMSRAVRDSGSREIFFEKQQ